MLMEKRKTTELSSKHHTLLYLEFFASKREIMGSEFGK